MDTPSRRKGSASALSGPIHETLAVNDLRGLRQDFRALARSCADALTKSVQHYQSGDVWSIGTMPGCIALTESLETRARALVAHSQLDDRETQEVSRILRSTADLRAVARAAQQASQLSWLFRQDETGPSALDRVRTVGEAAIHVCNETVAALEKGDTGSAQNAALTLRDLETRFAAAEATLSQDEAAASFSPTVRRMARAALINLVIAGESMARVAARFAAAGAV